MAENKGGTYKGVERKFGPLKNGKGDEGLHAGALADDVRLVARRWRFPEPSELQEMRTQGAEGSQERLDGMQEYAETLHEIYVLAEEEFGPRVEFIAISMLLMAALHLELGTHQHARTLIEEALLRVSIETDEDDEAHVAMKDDLERLLNQFNRWAM